MRQFPYIPVPMIFNYKSSTDQLLYTICPEEYGEFTSSLNKHFVDSKIPKTHLYREITADTYIDLILYRKFRAAGRIEG
jgi:hypothetical protein